MQRNFLDVKGFLEHRFPELREHITGGNYPPPAFATLALQIVRGVQLVCIALFLLGDSIWTYIPFVQRRPPQWYLDAKANFTQIFLLLFFIVPSVINSLSTTGAFEIALDGNVVFSKLATGRFPTAEELIGLMKKAGLIEMK